MNLNIDRSQGVGGQGFLHLLDVMFLYIRCPPNIFFLILLWALFGLPSGYEKSHVEKKGIDLQHEVAFVQM